MVRVKRGNVARKRRNKILTIASGYRGAHSALFRVANQQVMKALTYSYIGRKQKKRIHLSCFKLIQNTAGFKRQQITSNPIFFLSQSAVGFSFVQHLSPVMGIQHKCFQPRKHLSIETVNFGGGGQRYGRRDRKMV